jgi:UDPglucose--hexose-1-phosphate uridylyltransferase
VSGERRRDPTTGDWTTFATHRQDRTFLPPADQCPLCPTRDPEHPTEVPRAAYDFVVFDNKFPSLTADAPQPVAPPSGVYDVAPARGATEVIVYSDDHDLKLADMPAERLARLVDVWADRYAELGRRDEVAYVFVFENKGEAMGVTLHHPHGQVYAYPEIPPRPMRELTAALDHFAAQGTCVYCDVVARERVDGVRVVCGNESVVAYVPYWARYPYEVHVTMRRHAASLLDVTAPERLRLAEVLRAVLRAYDGLFGFPMPYVMSMHQAPTDDGQWQHVSHLHIELTPPHRTATKLKYLAGSELGGGAFVNDTVPERTAAELRAVLERDRAPRP